MAPSTTLTIPSCPVDSALALERDLGVSFALAQVLVRRGLGDTEAARSFLAADEAHPASAFGGIGGAVAAILEAAAQQRRVTVHGDYDVDGVTSTAILVRTLRSIGVDVDWFLPSRTETGYGLSEDTVRVLAERGTGLLLLTDCGITSAREIALARDLGMDAVVVDHHRPPADGALPDAPIVHPVLGRYPTEELCAAGVASKLSEALLEAAGHDAAITLADLDLVALGTIADCVPLVGENRRIVRSGLRALARTEKPGLRALMRVAQVDPQRVSARDVGFRLAPRINAAGRVARADAALELLLTHDPDRAAEIAEELDGLNARRRFEETRILHEAEAQVAALGEQPAYVLSGEGWHPGVIGIVASRIAERHHRPTLVVGVSDGIGTGSGRSIPGVDLLAGLEAASASLSRFGGHAAAAGCTVPADSIAGLREAFVEHFRSTLTAADLVVRERVDALVGADELGHELAEELERLAPFGAGNPEVSLLVPGARLIEARPIGEGKHARFTLASGAWRAQAVGFGISTLPPGSELGLVQATFKLELNEFRGAVEPRLVLRRLVEESPEPPALIGEPDPGTGEWEAAVLEVAVATSRMTVSVGTGGGLSVLERPEHNAPMAPVGVQPASNRVRDRRGMAPSGTIGPLAASGERVIVLCADAVLRQDQCRGRLTGFSVCSWDALAEAPSLADDYQHVVALDPPLDEAQQTLLRSLADAATVHLAWGEAELRCSRDALDRDLSLRPGLVASYRALRERSSLGQAFGRTPARTAGRMLAVLHELGLVEIDAAGVQVTANAERRDLHDSPVFVAAEREHQERVRWLTGLTETRPLQAA